MAESIARHRPLRRVLVPLLLAALAGCGSGDGAPAATGPAPEGAPGSTPREPAAAVMLAEGDQAVVASGTRVRLVPAEAGTSLASAHAFRQQGGPPVSLDADNAFVTPQVHVPTELLFRANGDQSSVLVQPPADATCAQGLRCAGASRRRVSPAQRHVDGMMERRLLLAPKTQRFNLGGFGIDPTQNFPTPFDAVSDALTLPAEARFFRNRRDQDEHTWLRAMVLSESGEQIVLLALDAVGAGNIVTGTLARHVQAATGIPASRILFGQTHTHAGADLQGLWGGVPTDWLESVLYPQAVAAVEDALSAMRRVRLLARQGEASAFNRFRRPRVEPEAFADPTITLLQARSLDSGEPMAHLLQFNAHPTSINEDPRIPHPDYVLGAAERLEHEGGVALYFNGPIADAAPAGGEAAEDADAYDRVRARGEGLAARALAGGETRELGPGMDFRQVEAVLPVTNPLFVAAAAIGAFNRYYDFTGLPLSQIPFLGAAFGALPQVAPVARTAVTRLRIGDETGALDILTIPGEASNRFGQSLRALGDGSPMMLLGLTHNSFGYIIPADEFSFVDGSGGSGFFLPFTNYEEFVSLGPLTAPLLRLQAYAPLFDVSASDPRALPPSLQACLGDPLAADCLVNKTLLQLDFLQGGVASQCREAGGPEAFCGLLDPATPLAAFCADLGLPPALCDLLGTPATAP